MAEYLSELELLYGFERDYFAYRFRSFLGATPNQADEAKELAWDIHQRAAVLTTDTGKGLTSTILRLLISDAGLLGVPSSKLPTLA